MKGRKLVIHRLTLFLPYRRMGCFYGMGVGESMTPMCEQTKVHRIALA